MVNQSRMKNKTTKQMKHKKSNTIKNTKSKSHSKSQHGKSKNIKLQNRKTTSRTSRNKVGAGLFDFLEKTFLDTNDVKNYGTVMGGAVKSEKDFINAYEAYVKATRTYFLAYKEHIEKLRELEVVKNIPSLVSTF